MNEERRNTPIHKLRENALSAEIWENKHENGVQHSVTFSRSYRDKEGNWQRTSSFGSGDLLNLQHLAGRAHDAIRERQQERRNPSRGRQRTRQDREEGRER
ncbi:MAG: hypothetical protein KDK08_23140 [Rhizobiaceae bacterium]|nr:hypothetical protein [Rhizobiaceae bacterium]